MKTSSIALSISGLVGICSADFWIARTLYSGETICPTPITCTTPPPIEGTTLVPGDLKEDCDFFLADEAENGIFVRRNPQNFLIPADDKPKDDPLCTDGPTSFSFYGSGICGLAEYTEFFFRVSPDDDQKLDAATTDDFAEILAECRRDAECDEEGSIDCGTTGGDEIVIYNYLCTPINDSLC